MLWTVALFVAFLAPGSQVSANPGQAMTLVSQAARSSPIITCGLSTQNNYMHWYRYQEGKAPQRLFYYKFSTSSAEMDSGVNSGKYHVYEESKSRCKLVIRNLEESDSGVYFCATWAARGDAWIKLFGKGTRLIVIPTDKSMDGDFSPKPTIFLPSIAETTLHKAGTYLCLLENFFPDAIQVYWKEKNSDKVLESQQGNTMKIKDTYMKFSWLTVPQKSFSKEHRCIVKHETKAGGRDQEILFPAIQKGEAVDSESNPDIVGDEQHVLMLQLTQTSAYYTYLLLLVKSAVYLAIVTFSMFRRTAICGVQRAPNQ